MLKRRLLTLNASCEENESDFFCDLGHDPENASGPFPFAVAHAPVMPSENVVSLREKRKPHSRRNISMGDGRGSSRPATNTRPNSFRKHHQARSLGFRSNLNLNLRLVQTQQTSTTSFERALCLSLSLRCPHVCLRQRQLRICQLLRVTHLVSEGFDSGCGPFLNERRQMNQYITEFYINSDEAFAEKQPISLFGEAASRFPVASSCKQVCELPVKPMEVRAL